MNLSTCSSEVVMLFSKHSNTFVNRKTDPAQMQTHSQWDLVDLITGFHWFIETFGIEEIIFFPFKGCVCCYAARFLLVCFVCQKESNFWNKKKVFSISLQKLRSFLEIIRFWLFRYSNVMTSSNTYTWNTKHILLNALGSKDSLVIKCGQLL